MSVVASELGVDALEGGVTVRLGLLDTVLGRSHQRLTDPRHIKRGHWRFGFARESSTPSFQRCRFIGGGWRILTYPLRWAFLF